MEIPKTDREIYIENLEKKLRKASRARKFLDDPDGKIVTEWAQEQINISLQRIGGHVFKNDHEGYLYELGGLHKLQMLLRTLNSDASVETKPIVEQINEAKADG